MIKFEYRSTMVCFDDTGNDPEHPGVIFRALRQGMFYEQPFLRYIESLGLPGCYVDIGAHVGNHTIFFSRVCRAERVYSFEPQPSVYQRLLVNVELNGVSDRVVAHNMAVTDTTCEVSLRRGRQVDPVSGSDGGDPAVLVVPGRRLDDVIPEPVALIKIDVEGMEPMVLKGASRLIEESRPVIFAEAATFPDLAAVCRVLRRVGYRPTGRFFNDTPTYEFGHVRGPVARLSRDMRLQLWRLADSTPGHALKRALPAPVRTRLGRHRQT